MIDKELHQQVNGNRLLRLIELANDIARFLNVENHAKKAFDWLTTTVKNVFFDTWKMITGFVVNLSNRVQKFLGFGADEEIPGDSILLVEEYTDELVLPIF